VKPIIFSLLLIISFGTLAEPASQPSTAEQAAPIPEDIRVLVRQEMREVSKGMESLVFFIATGQWQQITDVANAIKETYIMKKSLTTEQLQELRSVLPQGFKQLDQRFHGAAGKMAKAAQQRDMELVQYYRFRMNQSCTDCHKQYAQPRFPGFQ